MKFFNAIAALLFIALATGCCATKTRDSATISGSIFFKGEVPKRRVINVNGDPNIARARGGKPLLSEKVIVNPNGTLRNVFVYVKDGLGNKQFSVPKDAVEMAQELGRFEPRVVGVQTGQKITFINRDGMLQHIHGFPKLNAEFSLALPVKGINHSMSFHEPEVMVPVRSDIHPWMQAHIGVLNHPYFFVTGADGTFTLNHLPAGNYIIEAWHEEYGTQSQTVTVKRRQAQRIEFEFERK